MIGYVYLGIFLLISGGYFAVYNLLQGSGDIRNFFSLLMSTVMFLLPMLTMRTYSEERKMRTDQLLLGAPIRSIDVAAGKFLAVLTIFSVGMVFTLLYVMVLAILGQFNLLMVVGNYLGMLVSASAFIAIGMFVSALTENQIIACIVRYAVMLGLWIIGTVQSYLTNPVLKSLPDTFRRQIGFRNFPWAFLMPPLWFITSVSPCSFCFSYLF